MSVIQNNEIDLEYFYQLFMLSKEEKQKGILFEYVMFPER